jgi:hypothetical protein
MEPRTAFRVRDIGESQRIVVFGRGPIVPPAESFIVCHYGEMLTQFQGIPYSARIYKTLANDRSI